MTTLVERYVGASAYDVDGHKIGKIRKLFVDGPTREPRWAEVSTGFLGTSRALIPLTGCRQEGRAVTVTVTKEAVKQAPTVTAGEGVTVDDAQRLTQHYRLDEPQPDAPEPPAPHSATLNIASVAAGIGGTAINTAAYAPEAEEPSEEPEEESEVKD